MYHCRVERLTVLVADDHPVFREGLARAIAGWPELDLVGEAGDGRAGLAAIRDRHPDVAVVDLKLPQLDGVGVAAAVTREKLPTRVLILSAYDDADLVYRAVEAGAAGYLTKDARREEIMRAIVHAARGRTVMPPALAEGLATAVRKRSQPRLPQLTERERQVLDLLCEGLSAPQMGKRLYLGTTTVKTHLGTLYEKLGVSDRAAAVAEAMRRGLVR